MIFKDHDYSPMIPIYQKRILIHAHYVKELLSAIHMYVSTPIYNKGNCPY